MPKSSSILGAIISQKDKDARASRFAIEAAAPPPPPPVRRIAHPDFGSRILRSDPEEKLISLLARRLVAGLSLTPQQHSALASLGMTVAQVIEHAAVNTTAIVAPEIYAENGIVVKKPDSAASSKKTKRTASAASKKSKSSAPRLSATG